MGGRHPTAVIASGAYIHPTCRVGPYCVIGPEVSLERDVVLEAHVVIQGRTSLGEGCHVYPFSVLGTDPQDLKYGGEPNGLIIGPSNRIREHVTIHPGTSGGDGYTRLGAGGLYMVGSHVAHDCTLGEGVVHIRSDEAIS